MPILNIDAHFIFPTNVPTPWEYGSTIVVTVPISFVTSNSILRAYNICIINKSCHNKTLRTH